jgi:hypothetical protein
MNSYSLTNNNQLALLNRAYFEALISYNETYSQDALLRLFASKNAYMSFKIRLTYSF